MLLRYIEQIAELQSQATANATNTKQLDNLNQYQYYTGQARGLENAADILREAYHQLEKRSIMRPMTTRENIAALINEVLHLRRMGEREEADRIERLAAKARITGYLIEPYIERVVGYHLYHKWGTVQRGTTMQCVSPFTWVMGEDDLAHYNEALRTQQAALSEGVRA